MAMKTDDDILLKSSDIAAWIEEREELLAQARRVGDRLRDIERKLGAAALLTGAPVAESGRAKNRKLADEAKSMPEMVERLLREAGSSLSTGQLKAALSRTPSYRDRLQANPNYFYTVMSRLVRRGKAVREGRRYRAPDSQPVRNAVFEQLPCTPQLSFSIENYRRTTMAKSTSSLDMDSMHQTTAHIKDNPADGKGAFETVTEWQDGAVAVTRARSFTLQTDEPTPLGGTDTAMDPMELLLASLGTCLTLGWVTHANTRGIEFRDLKITVTAPYDLRGYLKLDDRIRNGFQKLSYTVEVDSDADDAALAELKAAAEAGSPMIDNILNATPIDGEVTRGA